MLTAELAIVLPLLLGILLAMIEFGLLLSAAQRVQLACATACRVGTRPCASLAILDREVRLAAESALVSDRLAESAQLTFLPGEESGDPVVVEIRVPMIVAAPDALGLFGFSLKDRYFASRVVMRKE